MSVVSVGVSVVSVGVSVVIVGVPVAVIGAFDHICRKGGSYASNRIGAGEGGSDRHAQHIWDLEVFLAGAVADPFDGHRREWAGTC